MADKSNTLEEITPILIPLGIAVAAYFIVIKPLMSGLGDDPASNATVANQANLPAAQNPWNVNFAPFVQLFQTNGSTNPDGSPMTMQQYFVALKANASNLSGDPIANIIAAADNAYSQLEPGFLTQMTQLSANTSAIVSSFATFTYQTDVTKMAAYYLYNYNADLYKDMQGSLFKDGLTNTQFAQVINNVNAMQPTGGNPLPNLSAAAAGSGGFSWSSIFQSF
jgi:hypothetical protein